MTFKLFLCLKFNNSRYKKRIIETGKNIPIILVEVASEATRENKIIYLIFFFFKYFKRKINCKDYQR